MLRLLEESLAEHNGIYDFVFCDRGQESEALTHLARDGLLAVVADVPEFDSLVGLYVALVPTFSGFNLPTTVTLLASRLPIPRMFGSSKLVYDGPACLHQFSWITACEAQRILVCGDRWDRMVAAYKQQASAEWCKNLNFVVLRQ